MQTQVETANRQLPEITAAEHAAVNEHLPALIEAINATGQNRDVHTGITMHGLLLNLSEDEQVVALAYLQTVTRRAWSSPN